MDLECVMLDKVTQCQTGRSLFSHVWNLASVYKCEEMYTRVLENTRRSAECRQRT